MRIVIRLEVTGLTWEEEIEQKRTQETWSDGNILYLDYGGGYPTLYICLYI